MASFATLTLPDNATKMRFKEPFVSEAQNLKDGGIIPPGVFRGFSPSPQAGFLLNLNVDAVKNDSVAVVETLQAYNLTVRSNVPITVDMTGQVVFPVYVVIRTEYLLSPSPLLGLTTSKVMVVETAVDNGDPQKLHDDDVKLCRVLGFVGTTPSISTAVPGDRLDNGGPLLAQRQSGPIAVVNQPVGVFSTSSAVPVALPSSSILFDLARPSLVAIDIFIFSEQLSQNPDAGMTAVFSLRNMNTLVDTDGWQDVFAVNASGTPSATGAVTFPGIKRVLLSLPAGSQDFQIFVRRTGGSGQVDLQYPLTAIVSIVG